MFLESYSTSKIILVWCFYQRQFFTYLHTVIILFSCAPSFGANFKSFFFSENQLFYIDVQMDWYSFKWYYLIIEPLLNLRCYPLPCSCFIFCSIQLTRAWSIQFPDLFQEKAFGFITSLAVISIIISIIINFNFTFNSLPLLSLVFAVVFLAS